jgi:tellurite resistance protein
MSIADPSFLEKVAKSLSEPPQHAPTGVSGSILTVAAASYGSQPDDGDITVRTGFDPQAAALFEAVVEAAFLVANADGEFDDDEKRAFQSVVLKACGSGISQIQIQALVDDLGELLEEDGIEKRVEMVARTITKAEHQNEVLRIAALLAYVSGGVSDEERKVLVDLSTHFKLDDGVVDQVLGEAKKLLES